MKILMASILNFEKDINGVVVSANELMHELIAKDHRVELITPYRDQTHKPTSWMMRMSGVMFKNSSWSLFFILGIILKTWIIARKSWRLRDNVDVFHAHDCMAALAFMMLPLSGKKIVLHAHFNGSPWQEFVAAGYVPGDGWAYKCIIPVFKRIMRSERIQILAVSEHTMAVIHELLGPIENEPTVLYPGIRAASHSPKIQYTEKHIVNVGSLEKRKNQMQVINLLAHLRQMGLRPKISFIGPEDSHYKQQMLEQVQAYGLQDDIRFHGQLDLDITREMISGADLYLHTATGESFGRVLVEAMSSGTPVMAYEYPALKEILDGDQILEASKSLEEHARHIRDVLTDEKRLKSMQVSQYSRYLEQFTAGKMVGRYEQIIAKIQSNSRQNRADLKRFNQAKLLSP